MVAPHNTGWQRHNQVTAQPRLIKHFFSGGGALVKTKLTAGCLSPTIITSQHNITTFLRLHFQEGMKEGQGKRRGRYVTLCNIVTAWENIAPCTVPSVSLDNTPTERESTVTITQYQYCVCVVKCHVLNLYRSVSDRNYKV